MQNRQELFLKLFEPNQDRLWRFCLSISRNNDDAKEILSETIYQAYLGFDKVKSDSAFLSYLFTIASRNNYKKIKNSQKITFISDDYDNLEGSWDSPEQLLEAKEIYLALDKLPIEQKEVIILFDIMGFSRTEICEIQNISMEGLKSRLYRGRKKLSEILELESNYNPIEKNQSLSISKSAI